MKTIFSIVLFLCSIAASAQTIENKDTASSHLLNAQPRPCTAKDFQTALKAKGYYKGKIDGKGGKRLAKALNDYYKDNGMPVPEAAGSWNMVAKALGLDCRF